MISEGSRDTKDWSNDAENVALHHSNKLHFKIYSNNRKKRYFNLQKIFHNITAFYCINKCCFGKRNLFFEIYYKSSYWLQIFE